MIKMSSKIFCLLISVICIVNSKEVRHRSPRFISTYTNVITSTEIVTSIVPSSCVSVDPTLPPCRSVRYLNFPNFGSWGEILDKNHQAKSLKIESTSLGWGEYFGIYAPTITVTQIELQTSVVKDPRIVVTYAVKGCRPHKIPDDLDRCEMPQTISIQEIIPTSTIAISHSSSTINPIPDSNKTQIPSNSNTIEVNIPKNGTKPNKVHTKIESSTENFVGINTNIPTVPLPV